MNRTVRCAVVACAIFLGTTAGAAAHTITVETNDESHPLATGTPRIFNSDYEVIAHPSDPDLSRNRSAASHGTNTACKAIPDQAAVTITGGTCGTN